MSDVHLHQNSNVEHLLNGTLNDDMDGLLLSVAALDGDFESCESEETTTHRSETSNIELGLVSSRDALSSRHSEHVDVVNATRLSALQRWTPSAFRDRDRLSYAVRIAAATVVAGLTLFIPYLRNYFGRYGIWAPVSALLLIERGVGASLMKSAR